MLIFHKMMIHNSGVRWVHMVYRALREVVYTVMLCWIYNRFTFMTATMLPVMMPHDLIPFLL